MRAYAYQHLVSCLGDECVFPPLPFGPLDFFHYYGYTSSIRSIVRSGVRLSPTAVRYWYVCVRTRPGTCGYLPAADRYDKSLRNRPQDYRYSLTCLLTVRQYDRSAVSSLLLPAMKRGAAEQQQSRPCLNQQQAKPRYRYRYCNWPRPQQVAPAGATTRIRSFSELEG